MRLKDRRRKHRTAEVPVHALNDIMFFLLLFFLIISTMAKVNAIKLQLPNTATEHKTTEKTTELYVTINKEYFIDGQPVKEENLESTLMNIMKEKDETEKVMALNLDKELSVQDLVNVMEIAARQKIRMYLRTTKVKQ